MNKSILIIDTPKSCIDCPVLLLQPKLNCGEYDWKNNIHNKVKLVCPLKPMPEKYDDAVINKHIVNYHRGFMEGYNDCVDEILGGTEDE